MKIVSYSPSLLSVNKINEFGYNNSIGQAENRKLLIRLLHREGETSRKQLAELSGLKQATVTLIINDFIDRNLVEETGLINGDSGRQVRGLRLVDRFCIITVRISVSYLCVAMYDIYGSNLYCHKIFMDTLVDLNKCCDIITTEINLAQKMNSGREMNLLGIGIGVEGSFVIKDQRYQYYDTKREEYFDFTAEISGRVSYPVYINRMSNYIAYYVWKNRWGKSLGTVVSFTLSYSVECGVIINGDMLSGSQGMAGKIGQIVCEYDDEGRPVFFKDVISVGKILENTRALMPQFPDSALCKDSGKLNIRDIINAYIQGDPLAVKVYDKCAVYCGRAINCIISMFNPDMVFFGDEVPLVDEFFEKVYREAVKGISPDVPVKLLKPDKIRSTKSDPSLLGAAEYIFEVSIENGMLLGCST